MGGRIGTDPRIGRNRDELCRTTILAPRAAWAFGAAMPGDNPRIGRPIAGNAECPAIGAGRLQCYGMQPGVVAAPPVRAF